MSSDNADRADSEEAASDGETPAPSQDGQWDLNPSSTGLPDLPSASFSWAEGGIIAGVSMLLATISIVGMLTSPCCAPSNQTEMMRRAAADLTPLFLWTVSTVPIFWACARLRPRDVGWGAVVAGHLVLAFSIPFAAELGQNVIYSGIVAVWPPSDPPDFTTRPVEVLTSLQFLGGLVPYLILLIIGLGRYEYLRSRARRARAKRLEREAEQLRAQLTSARLEALRMQINPHFLFNTLHTISTMAGSNPEGIQRATARLSNMLRYALSTSDQQEVPLDEELDMLDSYLDLQKLRLEDRLETRIEVEPGVRRALVPTLLLQPLVENAVQHGFEGSKGIGHLEVRAWRENDDLVLQVADNGPGLPDSEDGSPHAENGLGLQNLAERLDGLYGEEASLTFDRSDRGGLSVVIRLPFHVRATQSNLRVSAITTE